MPADVLCPLSEDLNCEGDPISHDDLQELWDGSCTTNCHTGGNSALGGLDLQMNAYSNLLAPSSISGHPRVTPDSPYMSFLYHKLFGTNGCTGVIDPDYMGDNDSMPPGFDWDDEPPVGDPSRPQWLEMQALRNSVLRWICCGAEESP